VLIQEMTRKECLDLLDRAHLGRLACAHETQPYIVPIYFAYDNDYLYCFSTLGQKIEWMRANPNVCVETDEVTNSQDWLSVIVLGRYEELPDTPEWHDAREYAHRKLEQRNPIWWEPGYAKTILDDTERPLMPSFYRIQIVQVTGHRASPEHEKPATTSPSTPDSSDKGWLHKILRQVRKQP
jgi:nitroimidazol reductase NimA-like FMN-containing flavoprotein (pyridoxamine 5'-phosphate oxidase superfamily)